MSHDPEDVVQAAMRWLDTPYRHQASTLGAGCDCLGLLRGVWRELNGKEPVALPPYRADWRDRTNAGALERAAKTYLMHADEEPGAGDVILFRLHRSLPPKHCGIMLSATRFMHAQEQVGVIEANFTKGWARRVAGVYKFPKRMEI